ncbi:hypothetical protein MMC07_009527 [Pseudocyphellaria aurata]|nr:hypothetical protein [Pseudocyphellaria aurata]
MVIVRNSTSGVLKASTSHDPVSTQTPATAMHSQSDPLAKRAIPIFIPPYTAGSYSGSTGCPIVSAAGSPLEGKLWQSPDASSLVFTIQNALLMLDQPKIFETVQANIFGKFSDNGIVLSEDTAVIRKAIQFFADAFGTRELYFGSFGEGAQLTKNSKSDLAVISGVVKQYERSIGAGTRFTIDLPVTVSKSLQLLHLADFFGAYHQCCMELSDTSSELHWILKYEGLKPSAHGNDSNVLDEYLIRKTHQIQTTTSTKRIAKTIKTSWTTSYT